MIFLVFVTSLCLDNQIANIELSNIIMEMQNGKKFTQIVDVNNLLEIYHDAMPLIELIDDLEIPTIGCFSSVLRQINIDCDNMTEKQKKLLTLKFTQCYYKSINRAEDFPFDYPDDEQIFHMSTSTYNNHKIIGLHITNLCYFARQTAFNEAASFTLIDLMKNIVDSANSFKYLHEEINQTQAVLINKVYETKEKLNSSSQYLKKITEMSEGFQNTLSQLTAVVESCKRQFSKFQFYIFIFLIYILIRYFYPEISLITTIVMIFLGLIDLVLSGKFNGWNSKGVQIIFKSIFLAAVVTYPIFMVLLYFDNFIGTVFNVRLLKNGSSTPSSPSLTPKRRVKKSLTKLITL